MMETKYRVIGSRAVAGVEPGGIVTAFPEGTNIEALVLGGHITPLKERKGKEVKEADGGLSTD